MKNKLLTALGLIIFAVIIILPPLIHGYIYPNLGDDSAEHIKVFELIRAGQPYELRYLGYAVIGYPLVWINQLTHVSLPTLYLWFYYASLIGVGLSFYFVTSSVVNRIAGWLSLLIVLWCSQGVLFQFYFGQIFNLINMGIILPWLLYFAIKQNKQNGLYALFGISVLFGAFHSTGIYAPIVCVIGAVILFNYLHWKKAKSEEWINVMLPLAIVFFSSLLGWMFFSYHTVSISDSESMKVADINLQAYILDIVSLSVIFLAVLSLVFGKDIKKHLREEPRILFASLFLLAVVLIISFVTRISSDPFRQALDFAIVFSWLVAILVGVFIEAHKKGLVMVGVISGVIGIGLFHNIPTWFSYTSAVREPDKKAIQFINSQNVSHYNTNENVASWVYDRFTTAKFSKELSPLVVMRDTPMTPRSNPENKWYVSTVMPNVSVDNYSVRASYSDGNVTVIIWEDKK